ncbi:MAG: methionyl-tRNA formyltransferase, partial [Deltaproteobacteria bacterium]|nr:methionyl-tRNA formyltransferase [Deltaproteobacteria bacterium]
PDRPFGRGQKKASPPCAVYAKEKNIPLYQPEKIKEETGTIQRLKPDFIVTAAYGQFVPKEIREAAAMDAVNIHASLLPRYRGAAPIQWALIRGEKKTGVTLMRMTAKMDAGPIFSQKEIAIDLEDTAATLFEKLAVLGGELLKTDLPKIVSGTLKPREQNEAEATLAPQLKKEEGKIDWSQNAPQISNRVRGFNPWPAAITSIDNKSLKIYDVRILPEKTGFAPGTIYLLSEQGIHVACGESSLCLTNVQLEGKKRMPAADFARGLRLKEGMKLG